MGTEPLFDSPSDADVVREIGNRRGVSVTVEDDGLLTLHWHSPEDTVPIHRAALTDLIDRHNNAIIDTWPLDEEPADGN